MSIHDLGDYVELHAFHRSMTTPVSDDAAVPSELKIVRVEGNSMRELAVGMIELARMCGIEL